ncbi:MAG: response regulator, partial [Candidatus Aminicenantes bacterium]|nr:response regulator [Candidatus Aminicenantes bacterium]
MNQLNPVLLCVDDEEANLKLLEKLLGHQGYTVVSAGNGKDALLKIKSQAIDLVLLDIIMPGMDGFEVCRQIKEDQKLRSIPVIMVTTLSDKKDRIRGIEAGAEEFLSKPFDINEVLARIKILLKMKALDDERKHMEAELQKSHAELEDKVRERTTELADANKKLKADIIKREQIEETLRKSEENFRLSLEDSPLGVRIATAKGETIYTNKAILDIYGYANVAELNKIPIKERYTPQSYAEFQIRKKAREDGDFGPSVYEINIIRKNGEIRHLQVLRQEAFWNGTMQFQVIYQDITERIQAKEEIQRQLTEKEILIKEVHHRIKNNIASIGGLLSLHMQSVTNPEAVAVL